MVAQHLEVEFEFGPTNLACLFPTVLVIDPKSVPPPKYVFAFDLGAFIDGKMDRFLHPYMPLFDFLLTPEPVSAGRLINAVFGTNEAFFRNSPRPDFQVPPANFEADCYRHIVLEGIEDLDDRGTTPELLFADRIELRRSVKAVILPDVLAKDPENSYISGQLRSGHLRLSACKLQSTRRKPLYS